MHRPVPIPTPPSRTFDLHTECQLAVKKRAKTVKTDKNEKPIAEHTQGIPQIIGAHVAICICFLFNDKPIAERTKADHTSLALTSLYARVCTSFLMRSRSQNALRTYHTSLALMSALEVSRYSDT
jgi:hypothetical protein